MKNLCKGFCRACGTSCAEHEEALLQEAAENERLKKALERALSSTGSRAPVRLDVQKILDGHSND